MEKIRESDFKYICEHIANGNCIFFLGAGAGVSKVSKRSLPTGNALAQDLASGLPLTNAKYLPLPMISLYYELLKDRPMLDDFLIDKLNSKDLETPETYKAIVDIIKYQCDSKILPLVITTNYDLFLEKELVLRGIYHEVFIQNKSEEIDEFWLPEKGKDAILYKFHGCLNKKESIVITDEDYIEFLCGIFNRSKIPYHLQLLVQSKSILFIGYSLLDWDFRVFFKSVEDQRKSHRKKHFAVLLKPKELSDDVWSACKKFWLKKEVYIIEYDALEFLNEIKKELGVMSP